MGVENDAGQILMIRRSDNDNWAVPGGAIDLGESMSRAGVDLTMDRSMRRRLNHYLKRPSTPCFD